MEYHPLQNHPEADDDDEFMIPEKVPTTTTGGSIQPGPDGPPGTGLIHFDIDPQNGSYHSAKNLRSIE